MANAKNVAILGATGAVGMQMIECLEECDFPVKNLKLLASKNSVGKMGTFMGEKIEIHEANKDAFNNVDIVLSAVENDVAEKLIPHAVNSGAIVVDNSSAYRLDKSVPLVVANVNDEDIKNHSGIIANPNCATIIAMLCIAPLHNEFNVKRIICSTYQAASGAGILGINELNSQLVSITSEKPVGKPSAFQDQLAMNLIPQIGSFEDNLYSTEEMKMQNEGRKILHDENLRVNCTCVRVPILRSHSESITIECEHKTDLAKAKEILAGAKGVRVIDDIQADNARNRYPMPLYTSDQDLVFVGRIRNDISNVSGTGISFWCTGDQIRIGAATNAVKIAEQLK